MQSQIFWLEMMSHDRLLNGAHWFHASCCAGVPDAPTGLAYSDTTWHSAVVSWSPGFDGGYNQTFVVAYSTKGYSGTAESGVVTGEI